MYFFCSDRISNKYYSSFQLQLFEIQFLKFSFKGLVTVTIPQGSHFQGSTTVHTSTFILVQYISTRNAMVRNSIIIALTLSLLAFYVSASGMPESSLAGTPTEDMRMEASGASNGKGEPTIIQVEIQGRPSSKPKKWMILWALRTRLGNKQFADLYKQKMSVTRESWNKHRKVWIITVSFQTRVDDLFR